MNEKKIKAAVEEFTKNPHWKAYYEQAPSEACKRHIALEFYYSESLGEVENYDEYKAEREKLQGEFTREDWAHLYKYAGNNPWKAHCKKQMEA